MKLTANMLEHIKDHSKFPAPKAQLVKECNNLEDFTAAEKKWFSTTLPSRTYNSAEEVLKALRG